MFTLHKSFKIIAGLIVMLTVLSACGGNSEKAINTEQQTQESTATPQPTNEADKQEEQRDLTDPLGHTVTVPSNPQKIIASYLEDYLITLGVKPVAQWSVANSPMKYLQNELEGLPLLPHDLPFEAVTSHEPDLIIIGDESLIANDKYNTYNRIAPVYALGTEINADWRRALQEIGKVLGKESEAEAALAKYNAKVEAAREKLHASGNAPSAIAIWLVGGTFWLVSEGESSGAVMYKDLGLAVPKLVHTTSQGDGGIWKSVSMEALAQLDADHIFLINSDQASGSEALNDPVWKSIKAVKNGNVHEFDAGTSWLYTGPIANSLIIDDIVESLTIK